MPRLPFAGGAWRGRALRAGFLLGACGTAAGLSGCYAGLAALVFGGLALGGRDEAIPAPLPVVSELRIDTRSSRDRVEVEFELDGGASELLGARLEYTLLDDLLRPQAAPHPASAVQGAELDLERLPRRRSARFVWDAERDLRGAAAQVQVVVTPLDGGREGHPLRSQPFLAGNTPVELRNIDAAAQRDRVVVTFELADEESDRIQLASVEVRAGDALDAGGTLPPFEPLPAAVFEGLRRDYPSAPRPEGALGSFGFSLAELDREGVGEELRRAGRRGFLGEVQVRAAFRDFPEYEAAVGVSPPVFADLNEPPQVELLAVPRESLAGGIVPIRYRLFDPDKLPGDAPGSHLASIEVQVALGGRAFEPAIELPAPASSGPSGLATLDLSRLGDPEAPFHTFLWDAASQAAGEERAVVAVTASDRERGPRSVQAMGEVGLMPEFERTAVPLWAPGIAGYYPWGPEHLDGDGIADLLVSSPAAGQTLLRGGESGLRVQQTFDGFGGIPGDVDGDGHADIVGFDPENRARLLVYWGSPNGIAKDERSAFELPFPVPTVTTWATADFNDDGKTDLIIVFAGLRYLRAGAGRTGYSTASVIPREVANQGLAMTNLDGDRFLDLVFFQSSTGTATVAWGGADGLQADRLSSPLPAGLGDPSFNMIARGDFDGDGIDDLAVAYQTSDTVSLLLGDRARNVATASVRCGIRPGGLMTADFDGDGLLDLAAGNSDGNEMVYLPGPLTARDGVEPSAKRIALGPRLFLGRESHYLAAADLDGDGFTDLAVSGLTSNRIALLRGGAEGLSLAGFIAAGPASDDLAAGDFNGDGSIDLAVTNRASNELTFLAGRGSGFTRREALLEPGITALAGADFDGDGFRDLIAASPERNQLTLLRGGIAGPGAVHFPAAGSPVALIAADLDGDGFPDAAAANQLSDTLSFLRGSRRGLEPAGELAVAMPGGPAGRRGPAALAAADLDLDGLPELAAANRSGRTLSLFEAAGGALRLLAELEVGERPAALSSADFDGDGYPDLAAACRLSGDVAVLRGGPRGLEAVIFLPAGRTPAALAAADFDGDGFADLLAANNVSDDFTWLRGGPRGLESVSGAEPLPAWNGPVALVAADFDGDGFPDAAAANDLLFEGRYAVTWLRGGKDGPRLAAHLGAGARPQALAAADLDGDGFPDLLSADSGAASLGFFRGGEAGLRRAGRIAAGTGPAAFALGDFDGDGFADVAAASRGQTGAAPASVLYLLQRYLTPHAAARAGPDAGPEAPAALLDPRRPPRYLLEGLEPEAFDAPVQVSIIPAEPFEPSELARREAGGRGRYLAAASPAVALLRDGLKPRRPLRLTLRLRESDAELLGEALAAPERLRVFRRDPATGRGADAGIGPESIEVAEFAGGHGVTFPVKVFGVYLAALERPRSAAAPAR